MRSACSVDTSELGEVMKHDCRGAWEQRSVRTRNALPKTCWKLSARRERSKGNTCTFYSQWLIFCQLHGRHAERLTGDASRDPGENNFLLTVLHVLLGFEPRNAGLYIWSASLDSFSHHPFSNGNQFGKF